MTSPIDDDLKIVPLDAGVYAVHVDRPTGQVRIGQVTTRDAKQTWEWQHRDGERSSPAATNLGDVVRALVDYHRNFKEQAPAASQRRFVFSDRLRP
jgi:hypothetical protein